MARERSEAEARQREIDDLEAQQGMNAATQAMNEATQSMKHAAWVSTGFVAIGTFLLIWTLFLTQQTVAETRRIGEAQARAYVHAAKAEFYWGGERRRYPKVVVWVRNTGQTPAKWFEVRFQHFVYTHGGGDFPKAWSEIVFPSEFSGRWNSIGPDPAGSSVSLRLEGAGSGIEKALEIPFGRSECGFSIFGEIRYCTFFDEVFVSQFCFGRPHLPDYQIDGTEPIPSVGGLTISDQLEKPIALSSYSFNLETYKRVQDE